MWRWWVKKQSPTGDHRCGFGLFFLLPIGFFGLPGIFDPAQSHMENSWKFNRWTVLEHIMKAHIFPAKLRKQPQAHQKGNTTGPHIFYIQRNTTISTSKTTTLRRPKIPLCCCSKRNPLGIPTNSFTVSAPFPPGDRGIPCCRWNKEKI